MGEVCPAGVVVVRGRPRCRWRDGHRVVLWREEAVPGPLCRLFPARGRCGTRAVRVQPCVVAAGPVVGRGSGPWGVTHTSYKGAAEGTEGFVHQGRVRRPGLRLSADGGLQLPAQRQCPDLVDPEDGAQVGYVATDSCYGRSCFPMPPGPRAVGYGGCRVSVVGRPAPGLRWWVRAWGPWAAL